MHESEFKDNLSFYDFFLSLVTFFIFFMFSWFSLFFVLIFILFPFGYMNLTNATIQTIRPNNPPYVDYKLHHSDHGSEYFFVLSVHLRSSSFPIERLYPRTQISEA